MLELELFQCLNRQLGYAGRLGVVTVELPLPARGSQTIGANCDQALWFCPFRFQRRNIQNAGTLKEHREPLFTQIRPPLQSVMPTLLSPVSKAAYPKCWSHLANTSGLIRLEFSVS